MNRYIATFHSHFGAMLYCQALKKQGICVKPMPVPRKVSSSCGTCASYEHNMFIDLDDCELDGIYLEFDDTLECVLKK